MTLICSCPGNQCLVVVPFWHHDSYPHPSKAFRPPYRQECWHVKAVEAAISKGATFTFPLEYRSRTDARKSYESSTTLANG